MKTAEILRQLADLIDKNSNDDAEELDHQPDDLFVPPLQLKLELLKKATGVDSIYTDEEGEEEPTHSYDELSAIKRNAGMEDLNPVVFDALGDDEPLDV